MKPGYKTSEFWVTTVGSLVVALNQSGLLGSVVLPKDAILAIVGAVATYVISRGLAKLNVNDAE